MAESDLLAFEVLVLAVATSIRAFRDPDSASIAERSATAKLALSYLSAFGMTPSSRASISALVGKRAADELDEFVAPAAGALKP